MGSVFPFSVLSFLRHPRYSNQQGWHYSDTNPKKTQFLVLNPNPSNTRILPSFSRVLNAVRDQGFLSSIRACQMIDLGSMASSMFFKLFGICLLSPEPNMGKELKPEEISVTKPRCGSKVLLSTNRDSSDQGGCAHYIEGDFDSAEEAMEELEFSDKNCKASIRTPSPHSTGTGSYRSASQSSLDSSESHKADLAYRHHTNEETSPNECSVDYPIRVPIIGFETMEQRARFTVFKLQVIRSPHDSWFVFRRYTDFVLLSDKIVQLQLKNISSDFFIPLPPKRWFLDNFDRHFLEERRQGLQEFINRILSSQILCECNPVREFFCLDDPPGPHDSLEESRALCESLEEQTYHLKKELRDKEHEIDLLKSELNLYKSQIEDLKRTERLEISGKSSGQELNPTSGPSDGSDQSMDDCPEVDQNNFEGQLTKLDNK